MWLVAFGLSGFLTAAAPQYAAAEPDQGEVVSYPGTFFEIYEPESALDMVRQLPGFQIDDGGGKRGFGAAAGNILINDRRPSAKQDPPSAILRRIPASIVQRIELIRGQIGAVDIQGHSVLANIVLRENYPASIRWDASFRKHTNVTPIRPEGSISISDRWRTIDYSAGVSGFRATFGDEGTEHVFGGSGELRERRFDDSSAVNLTGNVYLNGSTWLGNTLLSSNASLGYVNRDEEFFSHRVPQNTDEPFRDATFGQEFTTRDYELGIDAERNLTEGLTGKAIFLISGSSQDERNDQHTVQAGGEQTLSRIADSAEATTEAIARLEFDWTGWSRHTVQANLERAYNMLDNALVQTDDTGAGPVLIDVPGANTRVEEVRYDLLLEDTWSLGQWTLNYGVGAETSTISQSGDANLERSYFFLKPQLRLTWSHNQSDQTRLRLVREVAQLDFRDFVSATVFLDDDLALGNPNLKPESTWVSEISHERRLGELAAVSLTAFHHWISDVQDLLPITPEFEAPGNIGDGRRWGLEWQSTVPMEWVGLTGARVDMVARWQNSSVTDPVTGETRVLSAAGGFTGVPTGLPLHGENGYAYSIEYRQDLAAAQMAWGLGASKRDARPRFKVNELDVYSEEEPVIDIFIETSRWWDIKIGFEINNVLDLTASRDRLIYSGRRNLSAIERREVEQYSLGRRYILSMSGSF